MSVITATLRIAVATATALVLLLSWTNDGGAQLGTSLTITVEADGAAAEETFALRVDTFDPATTQEFDLASGMPVTVDVAPGDVSVFEAVPAGWAFGGLVCTGADPFVPVDIGPPAADEGPVGAFLIDVPEGVAVDCVFTNVPAQTGIVRVTKTVLGTNPNPSAEHQLFVEPFPGTPLLDGQTIEIEVNAGPTYIDEVPAEGFGTLVIECGDTPELNRFGSGVQINVPADGLVECTVINVVAPVATLRIEKLTEQDAEGLTFPFRVGDVEIDIAPSVLPGFGGVDFALGAGPNDFVELPIDGWFLQSTQCIGFGIEFIDQGVRITPEQGRDVTCTFVNALISEAPELGDANCDGQVDIIDALVIAQFDAGVREPGNRCPLADPVGEIWSPVADVDSSESIDIIDALLVARCVAGIPNVACPAPVAE